VDGLVEVHHRDRPHLHGRKLGKQHENGAASNGHSDIDLIF
jgi:hypothetical protein